MSIVSEVIREKARGVHQGFRSELIRVGDVVDLLTGIADEIEKREEQSRLDYLRTSVGLPVQPPAFLNPQRNEKRVHRVGTDPIEGHERNATCYEEYAAAIDSGCEIDDDLLASAWQWSQTHGPSNGWCGTTGNGAMLLRCLVRHLAWERKKQRQRDEVEARDGRDAEDAYVEQEAKAMFDRGEVM